VTSTQLACLAVAPAGRAAEPVCSFATPQYCANPTSLFGCPVPADAAALTGGGAGLDATLTADQQALLGCGPYWGTDCDTDGIDFTKADTSVLLESFAGIVITRDPVVLPGARGPGDSRYDENGDGLVQPLTGTPFVSEMAALSWNLLLTLVAFSQAPDPDAVAPDEFDPADPWSAAPGQCSYAQPLSCAAVQCVLAPEAGATASALASCLALGFLRRVRSSGRARLVARRS